MEGEKVKMILIWGSRIPSLNSFILNYLFNYFNIFKTLLFP